MTKTALITGITGQDGSYLAEHLLSLHYDVHGVKRRASSYNTSRIDHITNKITLHHGDMTDSTNLSRLIKDIRPDEVYNLAAQSHVKVSFETPEYTAQADGLGSLRLLEGILEYAPTAHVYQASTSELYGDTLNYQGGFLDEHTPFKPRSPYGCAKLYAYWITVNYREAYGLHASNGILFNHESPRRGETFVTRKITLGVSNIYHHKQDVITLGNIDAMRDWGHAMDYVKAMHLALGMPDPDDYVIATGEAHSVREFIEVAFEMIGMTINWKGQGANEVGYDQNGMARIRIDKKFYRPTEVDKLLGDATKARNVLGWKPTIGFKQLVAEMVSSDLRIGNYHEHE